jgi:hypothetical protein
MSARVCSNCGRRIVVRRMKTGRYVKPCADHDLCARCWKAERDRNRIQREEVTK